VVNVDLFLSENRQLTSVRMNDWLTPAVLCTQKTTFCHLKVADDVPNPVNFVDVAGLLSNKYRET